MSVERAHGEQVLIAPLQNEHNEANPAQAERNRVGAVKELYPALARQGVMLGHMRYVLVISLALVIIAFAIIYFLYF